MSVVPICSKMSCNDQTLQLRRSQIRRSFSCVDLHRSRTVCCASESSVNEKQLKTLSSYLGKLHDKKNSNSFESSKEVVEKLSGPSPNTGLEILDAYLDKVDKATLVKPRLSLLEDRKIKGDEAAKPFVTDEDFEPRDERKPSNYTNPVGLPQDEEASDLYLIGVLASINIAVILFEIASPIKTAELELSTIPLLYGAKVNHLIVVGEWWRLVTPMFLHSGIFDIGLSCWSLSTFGPKVCRGYGWFTFLLIYILGGFSGNLISFLHTPDPTVGGTGPVYAIIGAWLIYQLQNKDIIPKEVSETMFQKAMIATGLGLILCHFCPIDEWAHFGSVFTGVAYGFLACPTLQVDNSASRAGQDNGITIVNQQSDPWRSLLLFCVHVLVLSSIFFFVEPPLNDLVPETFF